MSDPRVTTNTASLEKGIAEVHLTEVRSLLSLQKRVEELIAPLVREQGTADLDEANTALQQQYRMELRSKVRQMPPHEVAYILEALEPHERLVVWDEIKEGADPILALLPDDVLEELIDDSHYRNEKTVITAFELRQGRLRQITVEKPDDLLGVTPIWVDLIAPTKKIRGWIGQMFDVEIPDPAGLTDLEASARFYVEDDGEIHLHSDFLLDTRDESRNVPVALILHNEILFTVRSEELPVFRLQRARARTRPGYVSDGKDVLLDLYAADVEYSANALEDVYGELERAGMQVLRSHVTDVEAARILASVSEAEDLNGRTRRSVLDTRRALSFLMRGKLLSDAQLGDVREILRDIESLDGHTAFLFNKINFLMDATDSAININQNKKIERLTVLSVVFMPINVLAGAGGMSEFSAMAQAFDWPMDLAYLGFFAGMGLVGALMFYGLRFFESRQPKRGRAEVRRIS
ncbi:CorA family divalent cation transporter [Accumulibacter sp.]|uniref:CorA family divalent cation transporter n=1 Tax=Accumulibacter sp. TaxID=2053492 RepID=UPI0025DE2F5B|nr:CorA family divalent cation transporter [Accumulibacter sp.]MCM8594437.1 magnesium transporter CorA [Accumulibacter sp.]MCM8624927.1 magnesium transporter CorA [Accumulibacter sp.]MDS4048582.1 CorA family divalent cation transporter [Accumulibacter sp.]